MKNGFYNSLNYIKKYNAGRLWNLIMIWLSFQLSKILKKSYHWGMPVSASIEPTTSCNLRCPQCPSGLRSFSRPTGMLNMDIYKETIDQLAPKLTYLTLYFQGEPYLNPDFLGFVSYAHHKNIYTATSSNAHHISHQKAEETVKSGLDRLIISIDGTEQETYEKYRVGGSLYKVLQSTQNLLDWKKKLNSRTPYIIWQFIVFKHNEHQIEAFKDLAKSIGVDSWAIKTAQIYDYENGNDMIPENDRYSRYQEVQTNGFALKNKMEDHCWRMWQGCVITWDGKVVPCCFDKDAEFRMGDLTHQTFKNIWKSDVYNQFRSKILGGRKNISICQNCTEGTKVWD